MFQKNLVTLVYSSKTVSYKSEIYNIALAVKTCHVSVLLLQLLRLAGENEFMRGLNRARYFQSTVVNYLKTSRG